MPTIKPKVAETEKRSIPARKAAVQTYQGQTPTIEWTIRDDDGDPVAVSDAVVLKIIETLSIGLETDPVEITGSVVDADNGVVSAVLDEKISEYPGIYLMEWLVSGYVNQGYLIVNRSLQLSDKITVRGPLTIPEIRLHLRDSDPNENFLLDTLEFDLAELAACIERPVMLWNETPPPIPNSYTTSSFPFRLRWLDGTIAGLYELAAHHYRRNSKSFTAASQVNLDDKQKAAEYEQKAQMLWKKYESWVTMRKVSINMSDCVGGTSETW